MAKCPLCGSDGDDLIFRFYCSNPGCDNRAPEKPDPKKPDWKVLPMGQVYRSSPPQFLGAFPKPDIDILADFDFSRRTMLNALGVPEEFMNEWPDTGPKPGRDYPAFRLAPEPRSHNLVLTWGERVPGALCDLVKPLLENLIGEPMGKHLESVVRSTVVAYLMGLVDRGELVRSKLFHNRWELHFTE